MSRGIAVLTVQYSTTAVPPARASAERLSLAQNEPNPFRAGTCVRFSLERPGHVLLEVFDVSGRRVRTLEDGMLSAGNHQVEWDGRGDRMERLSSGVYYCRLRAGSEAVQRRMVLLQ